MRAPAAERFWAKVTPCPNTGCWLWDGAATVRGYGMFGVAPGDLRMAHRFAYELATGTAPGALDVCHRCDVPWCVNPDHLFLGTRTDNMRDCARKGRIRRPPMGGERNPRAILTAAQVAEIRARYAAGGVLQRDLAAEYGVALPTIGHVLSGKNWRLS